MTDAMSPKGDNSDEIPNLNLTKDGSLKFYVNVDDIKTEETFNQTNASNRTGEKHVSKKIHKCEMCPKEFTKKQYLKFHERTHTGEKPHPCNLCGRRFRQKTALNRHFVTHKMAGSFSCSKCEFSFISKDALNAHKCLSESDKIKTLHRSQKVFDCELCGKKMSRKDKYRQHMMLHSGLKPYECETCGRLFRQKTHLRRHSFLHADVKPFICDICGMSFIENRKFREHGRLHTGETPYECSVCNEKFVNSKALRRHIITVHNGESMYSCSNCCRLFTFYKTFESHNCVVADQSSSYSLVSDEMVDSNHQWFESTVSSDTSKNLESHSMVPAQNVKPQPTCNKMDEGNREAIFITGDNLIVKKHAHFINHDETAAMVETEENMNSISAQQVLTSDDANLEGTSAPVIGPIKCKTVISNVNSVDHLLSNSSYTCGVCSREFKRSYYLTRHMLIHTGDRPYCCKYCGSAFAQSAHCRAHESIHDNNRPFLCEVCSKRFITSSDLKKHALVHLEQKDFYCEECGKSFKCLKYLNKHAARMHSILEDSD